MVILSTPISVLEITIFLFAIAAFVLALRFFVDSRKRLEELFPGILTSRKLLSFGIDRNGFLIPKTANKIAESRAAYKLSPLPSSDSTKEEIKALRTQLQQQQQELSKALDRISLLGSKVMAASQTPPSVLVEQKQVEQLRKEISKKDEELQRLRQQELFSQKLQERLEEVQHEFEKLQEKMLRMEKQSWQTADLSIRLEHAEQAQIRVEKSLHKKEERLRELTLENQQLHEAFNDVEEKLSQANLQRQQLLKKIQFLEGVNADMLQMAEASHRLKTEFTRMAELESMLHLMTEERDSLLKKP